VDKVDVAHLLREDVDVGRRPSPSEARQHASDSAS
jgi:hypothetical protein